MSVERTPPVGTDTVAFVLVTNNGSSLVVGETDVFTNNQTHSDDL